MKTSATNPVKNYAIVPFTTRSVRYSLRGLRLMMQAAPRYAAGVIACGILLGIAPSISLLLQREFVDHFTETLRTGAGESVWTSTIVFLLVAFILVNVAVDAAETLNIFCVTGVRDRLEGYAKRLLFSRLASAKTLDLFENPDRLNALNLAYGAIPRLQQIGERFGQGTNAIFALLPVLLLTGAIAWWIPLLLGTTMLPAILAQTRIETQAWNSERVLAEDSRRLNLIEQTLTRPAYAKDIRLFGLSSTLLGRWQHLFNHNFARVNAIRVRGMRANVGWSIFSGVGAGIPLIYVVNGVAGGSLTPGDLVLAIGAIVEARRGFAILSYTATQVSGMTYSIEHFEHFMDTADPLDQNQVRELTSSPAMPSLHKVIAIDDLSFCYQGSTKPTIEHLSVHITKGSVVAVVGENGAGKSTFAKLIGRLYTSTEGTIAWDGITIESWPIDAYRERLAFMTQDIPEFPFSLRDNLSFGRLNNPPSEAEIREILDLSGLASISDRSDDSLDTPITKELKGGTQISGGQWQRLALARVMLRAKQADLLVLDEPTAAFDPSTEHEMIAHVLNLSRGKTSIIITHRLALCTQVDDIIVFHEGRIVERGSHRELMARDGRYASMFALQAERYLARDMPIQTEASQQSEWAR